MLFTWSLCFDLSVCKWLIRPVIRRFSALCCKYCYNCVANTVTTTSDRQFASKSKPLPFDQANCFSSDTEEEFSTRLITHKRTRMSQMGKILLISFHLIVWVLAGSPTRLSFFCENQSICTKQTFQSSLNWKSAFPALRLHLAFFALHLLNWGGATYLTYFSAPPLALLTFMTTFLQVLTYKIFERGKICTALAKLKQNICASIDYGITEFISQHLTLSVSLTDSQWWIVLDWR